MALQKFYIFYFLVWLAVVSCSFYLYICSFQLICQELRGLALAQTMLPKGGSKMSVDAANSLDVPQDELKAILGEVACDIHGCYVLKSAQNDPFRFSLSLSLSLSLSPEGK
jgi:hypothetical protein